MSILMIQIFRSVTEFLSLTMENHCLIGSTPIILPAIVVKFTNRRIRDRFYKARPMLKCYNIIDIGLGRHGESNTLVQESLTGAKKKLLKNCLKFRKDQNFKFIWTYYGVIYLRRKEHTPASRITSVGDLEGLQPRRSTFESTSTATTEISAQPSWVQESNCCLNDLRLDTGRYPCATCDKLIRSTGRKLKCNCVIFVITLIAHPLL